MLFTADIITPANTTKDDQVTTVLPVSKGVIIQFDIYIPAGLAGLCYAAVFDGIHQIYPTNPEVYFRGDNLHMTFIDAYYKLQPPFRFTIKTYNIDDTYDHSIMLHLTMITEQEYINRYLPGLTIKQALDTLQTQYREQENIKQQVIKKPFPNYSRPSLK